MTKSKKGKTFTYIGGLDGIEIHLPNHNYIFANGEPVEVCGDCAPTLTNNPEFTAASTSAPADPAPKEV
jgi:hypothetical protein